MDHIRALARISIGRGCFFAALGIMTAMTGFITEPVIGLRIGAALIAITACVLMIKAHNAPQRSYRKTELWLLMDRQSDLPEDRIQQILGGVLADTYGRYARYAIMIAIGFWLLAIGGDLIWPNAGPLRA